MKFIILELVHIVSSYNQLLQSFFFCYNIIVKWKETFSTSFTNNNLKSKLGCTTIFNLKKWGKACTAANLTRQSPSPKLTAKARRKLFNRAAIIHTLNRSGLHKSYLKFDTSHVGGHKKNLLSSNINKLTSRSSSWTHNSMVHLPVGHQ